MLIYRFRITSEEADDFVREIEIQPGQTFRDFHNCILESLEMPPPDNAFFYITLKKDKAREEISLKSIRKQVKRFDKELDEVIVETVTLKLMKDCKVKNYIEDPHQRMTYEIHCKTPYTLHIELFRIIQSDGLTVYPACTKKIGILPKKASPPPPAESLPKPEPPKPVVPKPVIPPPEILEKFEDIIEDEAEIAKIEDHLEEFLDIEEPTEEGEDAATRVKEEFSMFADNVEEEEGEVEHLEDYDDLENLEMKYSRYERDQEE